MYKLEQYVFTAAEVGVYVWRILSTTLPAGATVFVPRWAEQFIRRDVGFSFADLLEADIVEKKQDSNHLHKYWIACDGEDLISLRVVIRELLYREFEFEFEHFFEVELLSVDESGVVKRAFHDFSDNLCVVAVRYPLDNNFDNEYRELLQQYYKGEID